MKRRKKEQTGGAAAAVQVRERGGHPFAALRGYMPLGGADAALYRSVREAVPIVDAAIGKLVRLSGGFRVLCEDERAQEELGEFLRTVNVGHAQAGFNAFLDKYLDSLLTNGRAVGEIVPDAEGREIAAVLCHRVEQLALREGETALDVRFCGYDAAGRLRELPRQELVLFTPLLPESENPYGVSLLRSMPFMAELLSRIYYAVGQNWERCGNVRFAVVYKPQGEEPDGALARERAELLAQEWSGAMQETRGGSVRDFVSVGDVSIRAIGADNVMPDCEVPVRQILEQLVAKTGLPPFLLGLSWSSTERMSSQQADMLHERDHGAAAHALADGGARVPAVAAPARLRLPLCRGVGRHRFRRSWWRRPRRSCTASRRAGSDWKMTRGRNRLERERKGSGHRRDGGGAGAHQPLCEEGAARGGGLHLCGEAVRQRGGPATLSASTVRRWRSSRSCSSAGRASSTTAGRRADRRRAFTARR